MPLVLTRSVNESILIGYDTTLTVREVYEDAVGVVLKIPYGSSVNVASTDEPELLEQQSSYLNDVFSESVGHSIVDYVLQEGEYIEVEDQAGITAKLSVKCAGIGANKVRVAIDAPKVLPIHREELVRENPYFEEPPEPNIIALETGYTGLYGYGDNQLPEYMTSQPK